MIHSKVGATIALGSIHRGHIFLSLYKRSNNLPSELSTCCCFLTHTYTPPQIVELLNSG